MYYLKSLFFSFLTVFCSLHIFSGIEVTKPTQLPQVGGDLLFAAGLGFLNSLIYPILKMINGRMIALRIISIAAILNFGAYGLLKLLPLGISITSLQGYIIVSVAVAFASFLINYLEMKHSEHIQKPEAPVDIDRPDSQ